MRTLTSGVIAQCRQHRFVAESINTRRQTTTPLAYWKAELAALWCRLTSKAQPEAFLDHASQAGALLGCQRLSIGQQNESGP